jgi:hypothetical protein
MRIIIKEKCDEFCLLVEDGRKIYDIVMPALKEGVVIELDFEGITIFSSPFFHSAIGDTLEHISYDDFNRLVKIQNLNDSGKNLLKRVIEDSKKYYTDDSYRYALDSALKSLSEEQ